MQNTNSGTVLITGASSGIGRELAYQFAQNGHPVILTARDAGDLEQVAADLSAKYQISARFVALDLEHPEAPQRLAATLQQEGIEIDILVNNAGFGQRGKFWEIPLETNLGICRVNMEAPVRLTHTLLPAMIARGRGRILNTASIAGFYPAPTLAIYHASKAFVLSWSDALATELEGTGITVTALCPGATDTDFFVEGDMIDTKAFQKSQVAAPQEVAAKGYDALMRGDRVFVPGGMNKLMVFLRRLLPESTQAKAMESLYEKTADIERNRGSVERKTTRRETSPRGMGKSPQRTSKE